MDNKLQLGITKIGDLLIDGKITEMSNNLPLEGVKLSIPEYQRPYKWTSKNVNQLFDDIEESMIKNKEIYRIGTLILHRNEEKYDIVDGQQRIITISLLLKCLQAEDGISFLNQKINKNEFSFFNIINNHRTLLRRVNKYNDIKEKNALKKYLTKNCEMIVVITDDISEAFQFFDSQNARGKSLYPHDLLKAYHLREMNNCDLSKTEKIVKTWEDLNQRELSVLFSDYLYRVKEWVRGNKSGELSEHNIDLFKGITSRDNYPYAQYYKAAYSYATDINNSGMPFVTGIQQINPFQLNAPIIAGEPFFEFAKHYFDVLKDIKNNDKYEGCFINDNEIVRLLDARDNRNGTGNGITRLMFDTAVLLYIDRFCPSKPSKQDMEYLNQFIVFAYVWAYSMRAQYKNVGWLVAQNYIMGTASKAGIINSFNIYKKIVESNSPGILLSALSDLVIPLSKKQIQYRNDNYDEKGDDGYPIHYLYYFEKNGFFGGAEHAK